MLAISLVIGTSIILLTWLGLAAITCGLGLALRRFLVGCWEIDCDALLASLWLGLCLTILTLQLWNFILPITWHISAMLGVLSVLSLLWHRRLLTAWIQTSGRLMSPWVVIPFIVATTWAANHALDACTAHDSGMYHIPAMKWAESFPVVTGLGNLHGRLAFNNSSLLYAAMLDHGLWSGRVNHVVNGFFLFAMMCQIAARFSQLTTDTGKQKARAIFDITLLAPIVAMSGSSTYISSLTTDVPSGVVLFVAASILFTSLMGAHLPPKTRSGSFELVVLVPLLALAVCFKLSSVVFAGSAAVLALALLLRTAERAQPLGARRIVVAVSLAILLMASWLVRGAALSGYPAYPSSLLPIAVDWRVPSEQPEAERAWIGHFARTYYSGSAYNGTPYGDAVTSEWRWLRRWLRSLLTHSETLWQITLPLSLLALVVLVSIATGVDQTLRERRRISPAWLMQAPIFVGTTVWFFTAPRPVFGFPLFWILAALVAALMLERSVARQTYRRGFILAALLIGAVPVMVRVAEAVLTSEGSPLTVLVRALIVEPGPDSSFHPTPTPEVEVFVTTSGVKLYVPREGNLCWDAPLPCTPHPSAKLRLNHPGDLGSGFTSAGLWDQLRWPNPSSDFLNSWRAYRVRSRDGGH